MSRIRTVKPDFFHSKDLASVSLAARLTFIGLWTYADDEGRCKDYPPVIRGALWPHDEDGVTSAMMDNYLAELAKKDLICRYSASIDGSPEEQLLHVVNFRKHQTVNRPTPSRLPACTDPKHPAHGGLTESSVLEVEVEVEREKTSLRDVVADRADVERVCEHLVARIEGNGSKRPNITKTWRDSARLMIDVDKIPERDIHAAIDWCQDSDFWRSNILSMPKLRTKYQTLRLQASRPVGGGRATVDREALADEALRQLKAEKQK